MSSPPPTRLSTTPSWMDGVGEAYADFVRALRRHTSSTDEARELAHDTWLRLAEQTAQGASRSPAYAHVVADHLAIDRFRHTRRGRERFTQVEHIDTPGLPSAPDVATQHSHREALRAVDAALQSLPERSRDIFLADRLDGTPHLTLAAHHGISIKTVEREVMRGLDTVETALRQWRGEADTRPRRGRRRALSALLGLAATGVGTTAIWQACRQWVADFSTVLATATGRIATEQLPDGSALTLDAASRAEVVYYPARRTVRLLAGSAFFAVARDPGRPFVISAGGHTVSVLGTRFEVALLPGDGLQVGVESGRVRVRSADGRENILCAGQRLSIDAARRITVSDDATAAVAPWREGWLDFDHVRLDQAVARLARYTASSVRVAPDAASVEVFGRVRVANSLAWLRLLPGSLPLRARNAGDGTLVLSLR